MSLKQTRVMRAVSVVVAASFLAAQVVCLSPHAVLATPADDLKRIEYRYYFRGNYEKAASELRTFLQRDGLSKLQVTEAREYLAAALIMTGNTDAGKAEYIALLKATPGYAGPDPGVFKPVILATYEDAQAEYASAVIRKVPDAVGGLAPSTPASVVEKQGKPLYKKWWFYAGVGAVLLIAGSAGGSGGSGGDGGTPNTGTVDIGIRVK